MGAGKAAGRRRAGARQVRERSPACIQAAGRRVYPCQSKVRIFVVQNGVLTKYKGCDDHAVIPEGVTAIGNDAFRDCWSLTGVTFLKGVREIGNNAFADCTGLQSVSIPKGVKRVGDEAFQNCAGLRSVNISKGVKEIGRGAFGNCANLETVELPEELTDFSGDGFKGTPWREGLGELAAVNHVLLNYIGKDSHVVIPGDVRTIGAGAFQQCDWLTGVTIPEGVTRIGAAAFASCGSLQSVSLLESVAKIDEFAFCECASLRSMTVPESVAEIGEKSFHSFFGGKTVTIHAPAGSFAEEYAQRHWIKFEALP